MSENGHVSIDDTSDLVAEPTLTGFMFKSILNMNIEVITDYAEDNDFASMEYDGFENLAGYICKRLHNELPDIRVNAENDSSYTWVNHLSEGRLSKPTVQMMGYMMELEMIFNVANGEELLIIKNYISHMLNLVEHVDCSNKIKKLFMRARMYFRIRKLNRQILENLKSKKRKYKKIIT